MKAVYTAALESETPHKAATQLCIDVMKAVCAHGSTIVNRGNDVVEVQISDTVALEVRFKHQKDGFWFQSLCVVENDGEDEEEVLLYFDNGSWNTILSSCVQRDPTAEATTVAELLDWPMANNEEFVDANGGPIPQYGIEFGVHDFTDSERIIKSLVTLLSSIKNITHVRLNASFVDRAICESV